MNKNIIFFIIIIFVVIFQISFLNSFEFFRNYLNVVLIGVVLLTISSGYQKGFIFALASGLLLDIYSPYNFVIIAIALITPVLVMYNLFRRLLANKSIYSLIIAMATSTITFHIILLVLINLFYWLGWNNINLNLTKEYIFVVIGQVIVHTVVIAILYLLIQFTSKKIKAKLLITERV